MSLRTVIGLFVFLSISSGAFCAPRGAHFRGPRVFIDGYFGFPYYYPYGYYPYYYPYPYAYPYPDTYTQPPVYSQPEQNYY